jgi:HD-GYP domain-containing protein (c-di-GMP phosphodiesterase class II)
MRELILSDITMPTLYHFRPFGKPAVLRRLAKVYRVVPVDRQEEPPAWELPAVFIADANQDDMIFLERAGPKSDLWSLICLWDGGVPPISNLNEKVFALLPRDVPVAVLEKSVEMAFRHLRSMEQSRRTQQELEGVASDLATLNTIGVALSAQRDTTALLDLILSKSRDITCCDAGSVYLVEQEEGGGTHLVFKLAQNDSVEVSFSRFTLPISRESIAGYVAESGHAVNLKDAYRTGKLPFQIERKFDRQSGYRTKSMLVVPMKNHKDEVIGVLQLINAKKHREAKLTSPRLVRWEVVPFTKRSHDLAASLASQAAVAVENSLLYRDIQNLFESFVEAAVVAIELRDPSTFGHSKNVAKLTVALAEAVDRAEAGPYKDVHFTPAEIQEIRYASILHDFGKVGVRDELLTKAKKIHPARMKLIEGHFRYIKKAAELLGIRKKLDFVLRNGNQNYELAFSQMDEESQKELEKLDEFLQVVLQANEPALIQDERITEKLQEIANWASQGRPVPGELLLTTKELQLLSNPKGTLDIEERRETESHLIKTLQFLEQIRWTKELKNVPNIAGAHHERLDGSGYPGGKKSEQIPLQSKMMAIADIFDALTAHDRPWHPAVSVDHALSILSEEVKSGLLDPHLFKIFVDAKVYKTTSG